jgi:hypothetical protein
MPEKRKRSIGSWKIKIRSSLLLPTNTLHYILTNVKLLVLAGLEMPVLVPISKTKLDPDLIFGTNSGMRIQSYFFATEDSHFHLCKEQEPELWFQKKRLESSTTWRLTTHSNETWSDFQKQNQNQGFSVLGKSRLETKFLDTFMCGNRIETSIILICFFQNCNWRFFIKVNNHPTFKIT